MFCGRELLRKKKNEMASFQEESMRFFGLLKGTTLPS